jgi:hypothetical protein
MKESSLIQPLPSQALIFEKLCKGAHSLYGFARQSSHANRSNCYEGAISFISPF